MTPILLMPTVGGLFVGTLASEIAGPQLGLLLFGAGLVSWLVIESVVLHRLMRLALPPPLRATLGLHLTPPAIACVASVRGSAARRTASRRCCSATPCSRAS